MSQTKAELLSDSFGTNATGTIPIGGIIMWSGSIESIPTGWSLCNGTNGTPNLIDRFVVSAGSSYNVGATGGSADAVVVSHSHGITDPGHKHDTNGGGSDDDGGPNLPGSDSSGIKNTTIQTNTTGISVNAEGVSGTNANLPPYYALAYIMRVS